MTPEEYYKLTFSNEYRLIKNIKNNQLISFNTMIMFAELYHNNEAQYWKSRCQASEKFIDESPCDPDIYPEQLEAYHKWKELVKKGESC